MDQRIIYPTEEGIAVIHPTGAIPANEVARKDVPAGVPYLLIDAADMPGDRTFRGAWDADFTEPHGVGIGADAWFAEQAIIEAAAEAERQRLAVIAQAEQAEQQRLAAIPAPLDPASFTALEFDGLTKVTE